MPVDRGERFGVAALVPERFEDRLGGHHSRFHREMNAFEFETVEKSTGVAD